MTTVNRLCPDGAVRTLTRAVRAWFVTPAGAVIPRPKRSAMTAVTGRDRRGRP